MKKFISYLVTLCFFLAASFLAYSLWQKYMHSPWTRDGRVRAEIINVAPDVSGIVTEVAVKDNQEVKKGDLLMAVDAERYALAVKNAEAVVANKKTLLEMYQAQAKRRQAMDKRTVSRESKIDADHQSSAALADYHSAVAKLNAAKLDLERTKVYAKTDGYITNLNVYVGDYAHTGQAMMALIDKHSFWVYGYFEETKLALLKVNDPVDVELMNGVILNGHVESIARGIYDSDNPESRDLVADVNPTFNWVRLEQRIPVRIALDDVPEQTLLAAGMTCTVIVKNNKADIEPAATGSMSAK
ncbi:multidrug resistance efflux pump [Methylophaga aminisulfidivorans MP]|uniref:Multidrug resistance efflux pump n=1 Tax=Methylophaga aminisulfidivorans MP TaxID=1026882 RepID=F5SWD6_9GAMM|nr:HlyD family secretion protein [Methylophaga aminisulfidivorans]EGL55383.1 multidrug resistance efflux pump [Methylophaga aminisulfidivorans MP]